MCINTRWKWVTVSVQTEDGWGMLIARTPTAESPSHAQDYCEALIILIGAMHIIIRICMSGMVFKSLGKYIITDAHYQHQVTEEVSSSS